MDIIKSKTVCFSGYRPQKFAFPLSGCDKYEKLLKVSYETIVWANKAGYDTFLVGGAPGFDLLCAGLVRMAKKNISQDIKLIFALPYDNFQESEHFDELWKQRFHSLINDCDSVINVTGGKIALPGCYQRRNEFMIDSSSLLICYYTGKTGGTANTVKYAKSKDVKIINVADLV